MCRETVEKKNMPKLKLKFCRQPGVQGGGGFKAFTTSFW